MTVSTPESTPTRPFIYRVVNIDVEPPTHAVMGLLGQGKSKGVFAQDNDPAPPSMPSHE